MKVNTLNYETYFLLYIDNELSDQDRKEVVLFLEQHPNYVETFEQLRMSVLTKEELVYEHKELLFRLDQMEAFAPLDLKESLLRKEKTIVKINFNYSKTFRISTIAASLLLVLGYGWYLNNTTEKQFANNSSFVTTGVKNNMAKKNSNETKTSPFQASNKILHLANQVTGIIDTNLVTEQTVFAKSESQVPENIQSYTTLEEPKEINRTLPASMASLMVPSSPITSENTYNEINSNDQDRTIYIANLEIDAEKFRGISRRINALLKITKTEKEK